MAQITEWYHEGGFINLITTEDGKTMYKVDIDQSIWHTLSSAKAHIDYLSK
jgi:hypothetical protein